ncbi:MAG: T9SS type A sorting domain-containing protein [Bacteroidia bacterium]|nr:T9SS type A sorting domain-containing protein [Bacteroidia bacterium]
MKQIVLLGVCLTAVSYGNSQNTTAPSKPLQLPASIANVGVRTNFRTLIDDTKPTVSQAKTVVSNAKKAPAVPSSMVASQIGTTVYQLQTNASTRNALFKKSDGTVAAVWTFSPTNPATDRGTGYAYFNGTTWSAQPSARIESQRTGWPSIAVTGANKEVVISHNTAVSQLELASRNTMGTGTWTENTTKLTGPSLGGNVWPRIVVGGPSDNTLHVISLTAPKSLGGAKYNKQHAALCYSRSLDGGTTWDKVNELSPFLDSLNNGFNGFGADGYAIDARGNTVAYVAGSISSDLVLMKSTDNGSNWTKKIILDFPFDNFNGQVTDLPPADAVIDTIETNDGSFAVLLDNNDKAHVWFGRMRMTNPTLNDSGSYFYFPGIAGLMYWNENMGTNPPVMIAGLEDIDNSGVIELPTVTTGRPFGTFGGSLTSHPSAGIDASGKIYLAYDALIENTNDGNNKAIRNVFLMGSPDGGATWGTRVRTNPDDNFEQVYPSVARYVNNCISYMYQNDDAAGHGIGTSNPDAAANPPSKMAEIYYDCFPANSIVGIKKDIEMLESSTNYPNPFNGKTFVDITLKNSTNLSIDVYNTMGQKVLASENKYLTAGNQTIVIDASGLKAGIYFYTLRTIEGSVTHKMIVQ